MKRWIHAKSEEVKEANEVEKVAILFDVIISCVEDSVAVNSIAAASKGRPKFVQDILKNPQRFLNDFSRIIESEGFQIVGTPRKSDGADPDSISCYFYATMTAGFSDNQRRVDLGAAFAIRTSNHELQLAEFRNPVQDEWLAQDISALLAEQPEQVRIIRVYAEGKKTYDEYLKTCKEIFIELCDNYRTFGRWIRPAVTEVTL